MKKILTIILFVFSGLPLMSASDIESPISVSLINLIANPEKYKDRTVEICGYYYFNADDKTRYIYLTEEYAHLRDKTNAIILSAKSYDKSKGNPPSGVYVKVMGIVDNFDDGERDFKRAYIKEIIRIVGYVLNSPKATQQESAPTEEPADGRDSRMGQGTGRR